MNKLKNVLALTLIMSFAINTTASAGWYWPFGSQKQSVKTSMISKVLATGKAGLTSAANFACKKTTIIGATIAAIALAGGGYLANHFGLFGKTDQKPEETKQKDETPEDKTSEVEDKTPVDSTDSTTYKAPKGKKKGAGPSKKKGKKESITKKPAKETKSEYIRKREKTTGRRIVKGQPRVNKRKPAPKAQPKEAKSAFLKAREKRLGRPVIKWSKRS